MAKVKIFELKNIINEQTKKSIESKDIQDFLEKSMGVKKTHSSGLEDTEVQAVKKHFIGQASGQSSSKGAGASQPIKNNSRPEGTASRAGNSSEHTVQGQSKPAAGMNSQAHNSSQRPVNAPGTARPSTQTSQGGQRPTGQGGTRPGYQGQQRPGDGQRPTGQGGPRPGYQGQQRPGDGQRPSGQGGYRQGYQGQQRPGDGSQRPADGNQRPSGQGGYRQGYQGQQRPGDGSQRPADGNQRPSGQGGYRQGYQGQQKSGESGQRPSGQGGYRQGYQGQQRSGEGGQRPSGQGGYRQGYQGQQRQGEGGQRPAQGGNRQGYQGQGGQRPPYQSDGRSQGNRPAGQGNRPGGGYQGQSNYSRPSGQGNRPGGGYNQRGFDEFKKDEDDKPNFRQGAKKTGKSSDRKTFDQQILDQKVAEKNDYSNKRNRDRMSKDKNYKDKGIIRHDDSEIDDIKKIAPKKGQFIQPKPVAVVEEEIKTISIPEILTIKELADKMKMPSAVLVKKLFLAGKMVSINQEITFEEAEEIALEYDIIAEKEVLVNEVEELLKEEEEDPATMKKRPPVVCVMGHVDHGKTSLLDAIRETNVTSREAGGITQHIGAYVVEVNKEKIAFLDTPGHEAFTSMRMRGAQSTDIAILVVAADDGVMPQTVEAISHAKAAGVQIIVAINKIDKPSANIERVKQELTEYELIAEDWGGDTIFVPVSAHTKEGIDQLLEMILLTAEMAELKANPNRNARGLVIEAELDKGRGPVATILVQKGTLHVGDNVAVGSSYGKVRAMVDDKGRRVKEATPSTPVEILGLNEVPDVGEIFMATDNEKEARTIAEAFITQGKEKLIADTKARLSLDGLFSQIQAGNIKELNLIIKADVQGSVEAMKQSLVKLSNDEVAVRVLHGGVGAINESDVILASTSNAIIIGFNVRPDNAAKETADREKIDIKLYRVIYNAIDDIEAAMKGLLDPVFEEKVIGHAEVRQTFKASGIGTIAGSYVTDGKIQRGSKARIYRDDKLVYEGILASLKRFQDDVKEVATGYECGLVFEKYNDVKEGDKVELYIMVEVPR
ncbi:translation initiation factor IF-2 [Mobilitalea sibirica]|uniref:Translation initiation factor IF-2 n=1 Tax=Mobilitalea sibirica TaxID=1462919 RepID=A0A8J7HEH6_9FIRM|nr:translation initiation factor IF-2 [Mobilitalea sibirica]MBH1942304.1 translation initiation factor IF-2 [Mobilitalea sibirica]